MPRICIVSCVSQKVDGPVPAADLYVSDWFKKARAYAETHADRWFILSAEHHLLTPTDLHKRYEKTLIGMGAAERKVWADRVLTQLLAHLAPDTEVTVLAGDYYREYLVPALKAKGFAVRVPMQGRKPGEQKSWLVNPHAQHVERFYDLLDDLSSKLGGPRNLGECSGRDKWPERGIYFFFEPREARHFRRDRLRVVRIGTHAITADRNSTLWGRLRAHRGTSSGHGNHRGSIWRLHSGAAIMRRENFAQPATWLHKHVTKAEKLLEKDMEWRVSDYLATTSVLWLDVDDAPSPQSDRAMIEKNAIALLSQVDDVIDPPSQRWLGLDSVRDEIARSGLWNVNHVGVPYNPVFLDVMEKRVRSL